MLTRKKVRTMVRIAFLGFLVLTAERSIEAKPSVTVIPAPDGRAMIIRTWTPHTIVWPWQTTGGSAFRTRCVLSCNRAPGAPQH